MKTIYLLLIAVFIGTSAMANAKQGSVTGKIIDEQQKPVDYVTVGLFKVSDSSLVKTALTNADGKFEFVNINIGSYYIKPV